MSETLEEARETDGALLKIRNLHLINLIPAYLHVYLHSLCDTLKSVYSTGFLFPRQIVLEGIFPWLVVVFLCVRACVCVFACVLLLSTRDVYFPGVQ